MENKTNEFIALLLTKIIDENKLSEQSEENELWKLGYKEAIDMVIIEMNLLHKQFNIQ